MLRWTLPWLDERATCFEQAECESEAFTACNDLQAVHQENPCGEALSGLTAQVLEACPDLGLLSR